MRFFKIFFCFVFLFDFQCYLKTMGRPHRFSFSQLSLPKIEKVYGNPSNNVYVGALFCEIKNFQEIYSQNDIVSVAGFLKYYSDRVVNCIKMFGGAVNKFFGASFFAVFPGSADIDDSVLCNHIVSCIFALISLEEEFAQKGIVNLDLAIGTHFGFAAFGTIGNAQFHEDTYVGDAINIASRLQKACCKLDQNVLISQKIFKNLTQKYKSVFSQLSFQSIKGRTKKVCCYGYRCLKDREVNDYGSFSDCRIYKQYFFNLFPGIYHEELNNIKAQKYAIICCDIRNFTTYCERDPVNPDAVLNFLNIYYAEVVRIVAKHGGYVYKFLGDGILVVFPIASGFDYPIVCERALMCACNFVNVAQRFKIENGVGIDIDDFFLLSVGLSFESGANPICNNIFLAPSLKRVFDLESVNKNPYVHSLSTKHIIISNIFYNSMAEKNRNYFVCANSYIINKKTPVWFYAYDGFQSLPSLRNVKRNFLSKSACLKKHAGCDRKKLG